MNDNNDDDGIDRREKTSLTDKEELYCQLRASGQTKSGAAKAAYSTNNPRQVGWITEQKSLVQERIRELKEERAEAYGLDPQEQIRRYNELYQLALAKGSLTTAAKMLERLDILGGFEAPTKSVTLRGSIGESLKNPDGDLKRDMEKFSKLLGTHTEKSKEQVQLPAIDTYVVVPEKIH